MCDDHPWTFAKTQNVAIWYLMELKWLYWFVIQLCSVCASMVVQENLRSPFVFDKYGVFSWQAWVLHEHEVLDCLIFRGLSTDCKVVCWLKRVGFQTHSIFNHFEKGLHLSLNRWGSWRHIIVAFFDRNLIEIVLNRRLLRRLLLFLLGLFFFLFAREAELGFSETHFVSFLIKLINF